MKFGILGPFQVLDGGRQLDIGSPKQRMLLAVLVVAADRVVSVDRLMDDLWGEQPPAGAMANLQSYVSNLRRVLEPSRLPRQPAQVLVTRPPGYVLCIDADSLDAGRFEALAAAGHRLLAEGRPGPARDRLGEALDLWRGPALADFGSETFARAEAARLEELRLVAVEDRLEADLDLGAHAGVVAEAEALVVAHPLRERLRELAMVGLYRSGRQAEALRAYQAARRTLNDELGIEPGPALRRLEADILAQVPALDWRRADDGGRPPMPMPMPVPVGGAPAPAEPLLDRSLVGREAEMQAMEAALSKAGSGNGRAVLVGGDPGIGKTRLVEELVARAHARGWQSAWGGAVEGGGTPAYWPWVKVIRSLLLGGEQPEEVAVAIRPAAVELAQIVPEIKELTGPLDAPAAVDPETARVRLFEAVADVLAALGRRGPVVVVLDDLQWADVASLELLSHLAGRVAGVPLLVVGTYRPAEVDAGHALTGALASLARHEVVDRVDLRGLGERDVACLIEATTGATAGDELLATFVDRTDGNPFFVAELARLLASERRLEAGAVPAGVRDVLRRRLGRLPDESAALLSLAAVAGREFELRVLELAAGLDSERTLDLVEAALLSGLVVEHPDAVDRFRFSHDLVREAILQEMSALRRGRLHLRIGESIETLYGGDDARVAELANHFFHAAPTTSHDKAVSYAVRAAEVASARLAHEQAEEQLRRALDRVGRMPAGVDRDRTQLDVLLRLINLLMATEGYAAAENGRLLALAHPLCVRLGESTELGRLLYGRMTFQLVGAEHEAARDTAEQLLDVTTKAGQRCDIAAGHLAVGVTALHLGDFGDARAHLDEALAARGALDDPDLALWSPLNSAVACLVFSAWTTWFLGDPRRARVLSDDALAVAQRIDPGFSTAHALLSASYVATWDGDVVTAGERADELLRLSEEGGFALYVAMGAVVRGWVRAREGDPGAGVAQIQGGAEFLMATGTRVTHTLDMALLADAQLRAGRPQDALASVDRALELAESTAQRYFEAELHRLRGEVLSMVSAPGDPEVARELNRAVTLARAQGATPFLERATESLARLLG